MHRGDDTILITGAENPEVNELIRFIHWKYPGRRIILADTNPVQPNMVLFDAYDAEGLRQWLQLHEVTMILHLEPLKAEDTMASWETHITALLVLLEAAGAAQVSKCYWAMPAQTKGTIQEIVGISGNLWCKWYSNKYGIDVQAFEVRDGWKLSVTNGVDRLPLDSIANSS